MLYNFKMVNFKFQNDGVKMILRIQLVLELSIFYVLQY